jgi:hypothetical protein
LQRKAKAKGSTKQGNSDARRNSRGWLRQPLAVIQVGRDSAQAYDTFSKAADTKALKVIIEA